MYRPPRRAYPVYAVPAYGMQMQMPMRGAYGQPFGYGQQTQNFLAAPRHPYLDSYGIRNKFLFSEVDRKLLQICQRHPGRLVAGDLVAMKSYYADKSKAELAIPLDVHVPFKLKNEATVEVPEPAATKAHDKDKTRYFAKVLLFGGPAPEDEKMKGKIHLAKRLNFLLVRKEGGSVSPIGAEWSAEKDGATPNDATLQKTAIRAAKDLIGLDLSKCKKWLKFAEFRYTREDGPTCTVVFLPNVWDHFPEGIEPATQVKEETKEVKEEVEEEEVDPEDASKTKKVKKQATVSKAVKVPQYRPHEMSLHTLLEYDCSRPVSDDVLEACLLADCFHELLQRDFGLRVLEILKEKKVENEENEKKRKREEEEAAAKKAKTEEGEAAKTEEKKEEKKEEPAKPKTKLQHTVNQDILLPFQYFDRQPKSGLMSGSLRREILEGTFHQYGTMTKRDIDDLLQKGANLKASTGLANSPLAILYYVKLATTTTEVPVEEEKAEDKAKATDGKADADESMAEEGEGGEEPSDGPMTEASLNKLLLKDLRTKCEEKGLSTAGKKAELIERLLKGA